MRGVSIYISVSDAAEKFHISKRRVQLLCEQGRIEGASRMSGVWLIPTNAQKPTDARRESTLPESQLSLFDDFYRIEKTFQRSINDSLSLGYRGISTFSSSFDQSMLDYLYAMGSESFFYISIYNGATIVFDSLMSVKYVLSHDEINKYYEAIAEENGITTYYNPYVLPLGFMVNNDLTNVEIIAGNPFKLQNEILSSMIGNYEKEYFSPLEIINISYENLMVEENEETTSYSKIDKNYEGIINLDVKVNSNYPLYSYFSVNDHFYNFFVDVNGKTVSNVSGAINDLGQYKEGETINIRVRTNDDFTMDNYHVYSLDMDKFA